MKIRTIKLVLVDTSICQDHGERIGKQQTNKRTDQRKPDRQEKCLACVRAMRSPVYSAW